MTFDYPVARELRRHGPLGYAGIASYRPWIRDDFCFRCVYCLKREQWGQVTGEFDADHFQPQARYAELTRDYDNLLYACRRCNLVKGDAEIEDPFLTFTRGRLRVSPDGSVIGADDSSLRLILKLDLNSPRMIQWRIIWLRLLSLAEIHKPELLKELLGFPEDLPDLSKLRPPGGNLRPEGVSSSWHSLAKAGELPEMY